MACLEGYARDVGAAAGMRLREMPKHDLFSQRADALRTFAEAHARKMMAMFGEERGIKPPVKGGIVRPGVKR